jgi:hypothetical protein
MAPMRNPQRGASALVVLGIIVAILGVVAIAIAPEIMNSAEIGTLRKVGGVAIAFGALLAIVGVMNRKTP